MALLPDGAGRYQRVWREGIGIQILWIDMRSYKRSMGHQLT